MGEERDEALRASDERVTASFYSAEPAEYVLLRLVGLVSQIGYPGDHTALLRRGLDMYGLSIKVAPDVDTSEALERYARVESTALAHHAIEAFIRLFIAHASGDDSPALAVAQELNFATFKKHVRNRLVDDQDPDHMRLAVSSVMLAATPESVAQEIVDRFSTLIRDLAQLWLDDAPLYNVVKHGLAAGTTSERVSIAPTPDGPHMIMNEGDALEYLIFKRGDAKGEKRWFSRTHWVDVQENVTAAFLTYCLTDSLWRLAKWRYGVTGRPESGPFIPHHGRLRDFLPPRTAPMKSMDLLRYITTPR
jgi:hypothetical protein